MGDNTAERWVTLRQAAAALGVSKETVRQRFKAGTLDGRRDNHGRILVAMPAELVASLAPSPSAQGAKNAKAGRQIAKGSPNAKVLIDELAELRVRVAAAEAALAEVRSERDRLLTEAERRRWRGIVPWAQRLLWGEN